jgi:histidinol phosphatase-like PHP family hydrolase
MKPIKGVIGLHSTLSDGKATPEALIAKAKASGLQWVAFTEQLEILAAGPWNKRAFTTVMFPSAGERSETDSPDKWEQLRKICKDASTADFTALPGNAVKHFFSEKLRFSRFGKM